MLCNIRIREYGTLGTTSIRVSNSKQRTLVTSPLVVRDLRLCLNTRFTSMTEKAHAVRNRMDDAETAFPDLAW